MFNINVFYAAATSMKWIEAKMKVRTLFYSTSIYLINLYCNTVSTGVVDIQFHLWPVPGFQSFEQHLL